MDPRFDEINSLLIHYSQGQFDYKISPSASLDEIDAFITNINMLGEELKVSTISRNYFNNIFDSVSDMVFVLNPAGKISSINNAVKETLLYTEQELEGKLIDEVQNEKTFFFGYLKDRLNKEPLVYLDMQIVSQNKQIIPVNCSCSFLYNPGKEVIGYLLVARDQTKIKKYERSLIESEKKYRNIFESSSDCLFILDVETRFKEINEAGIKLFKYPLAELKKKKIRELIYDQNQRAIIRDELDAKGSVVDYELNFVDAQKNIITCLVSASAMYNDSGEQAGWRGIIKDISEHRKTENLVRKAIVDTQEKERIRIARDIHDSLKQKISGIRFYLGALKNMPGKARKTKFEEVLNKSNLALNDVLSELSAISFNLMPGTLQHFGLRYAINELCHKMEEGSGLKFKVDIDEDFAIADKTIEISLFRIIQEFINNAAKHGKATRINIKVGFDDEEKNILAVLKDNGKGFEIKKPSEYGGMGIINAHSRVESHNGNLKISSQGKKGTAYEIIIPLIKEIK